MLLGKINGATREDSSIFSDKFKRHYQQVRVKVCNHLFTLNFYITSSSRFSQLSISHNESPNFILRVSELLEGGKV